MSSQQGNGSQSGKWHSGSTPPDLEDLIRQGQNRLKQLWPGGGPAHRRLESTDFAVVCRVWRHAFARRPVVAPPAVEDDPGNLGCSWKALSTAFWGVTET
jgi:hypothetical protein